MTSRKRDGKEMEEDWFEVMGLEWDVTADDVNKAYRKLALKLHPDKNPDDPNAADKFDRLKRARDFLMDDEKRSKLSTSLKRNAEATKRRKLEEQARNKHRNAKIDALEQREKEAREKASERGVVKPVSVNSIREKTRMERERMSQAANERMQQAAREASAKAKARDDDDDDDMEGGSAMKVPYGTSTEIKVKWRKRKRPEPSMSEEDMLWKIFGKFGQIDYIELTGAKGNAGLVKFAERKAADLAVKEYEMDEDMKVYIPADKKYRIFQKAFDPNTATGLGGGGGGLSGAPSPVPPSAPYNKDFEDLTLRMLRQAAERKKLEKQLRQEAGSTIPSTDQSDEPAPPMEGVTPIISPQQPPAANGGGTPPTGNLFLGGGGGSGGSSLFGGVGGGQPGTGTIPQGGVRPSTTSGSSGGGGGLSLEGDVLARMRGMSKLKAGGNVS